MANPEHLAKLKEGTRAWNEWRHAHPGLAPDLSEADLTKTNLRGANLSQANLSRAKLRGAYLRGADLNQVNLSEADLFEVNICGAGLGQANLSRANLAGAYLRGAYLRGTDLRGTDLSRANLSGADFSGANLRQANLSGAYLNRAYLSGAHLGGANLSGASLNGAGLIRANLSNADFRGADLVVANLSGAILSNTDLTNGMVGWTVFADNDLSKVKGLGTVTHLGPSTIGIDTIYKFKSEIPVAFLRKAGVPENIIISMRSLIAPIQFYSCFISYSTKDKEFADRLYADLQNKGVRCWFAPHDVKGGIYLHQQIETAIRECQKLLLILSYNSMNSPWVEMEIKNARERERNENKRVLFPVKLLPFASIQGWRLFDADSGEDLAEKIRKYYIPDFSEWENHDSYQAEFEKLLRDLRTDSSKTL